MRRHTNTFGHKNEVKQREKAKSEEKKKTQNKNLRKVDRYTRILSDEK